MIGTRSLLAALLVSAIGATSAFAAGAAEAEASPGSAGTTVPAAELDASPGFDGDSGLATLSDDESASIRTIASQETSPAREIATMPGHEEPVRSGPDGLQHVSWSGDHLVIGAGTLIVILLVLVLIT